MDEAHLPEHKPFVRVDVRGKTTALWQSLRPKLIQAMNDVLDAVIDDEQGTTVRDEMKQLTTALLDYAKANLARPGLEAIPLDRYHGILGQTLLCAWRRPDARRNHKP